MNKSHIGRFEYMEYINLVMNTIIKSKTDQRGSGAHIKGILKSKVGNKYCPVFNYTNWIKVIYSSKQVITPECGCTHISAACKTPVIIIYDPYNT